MKSAFAECFLSFAEHHGKALNPFSPRHPLPDRAWLHCCGCCLPRSVCTACRQASPTHARGVCSGFARLEIALLMGHHLHSSPTQVVPVWAWGRSFIPEHTCPLGPHALIWGDDWPEEGPWGSLRRKDSSFLANFNLPLSEHVPVFSVTAGPRSFVNSGISAWVQPSVNSSCMSFLSRFMDRSWLVQESPSHKLTPCSAGGEAHNLAWCLWEPHCHTQSQNKLRLPPTLCLSPCLYMLGEWASEKTAEIYLTLLRNPFYPPPPFLKDNNNRRGNSWPHGPFSPLCCDFFISG